MKEFLVLLIGPITKLRNKYGGYPMFDEEDEDGKVHRNQEEALELNELKVETPKEKPATTN